LEEIPSDCESVASDTESESDDELEEVQGENVSELHEYVHVMQVEDEDTSGVDEVAAEHDADEERRNNVWLEEVLTHTTSTNFTVILDPISLLRKEILLKYSAVCLKMNYLNTLLIIQICMLLRNWVVPQLSSQQMLMKSKSSWP
jgi:hypothetical protein